MRVRPYRKNSELLPQGHRWRGGKYVVVRSLDALEQRMINSKIQAPEERGGFRGQ